MPRDEFRLEIIIRDAIGVCEGWGSENGSSGEVVAYIRKLPTMEGSQLDEIFQGYRIFLIQTCFYRFVSFELAISLEIYQV